MWILQLNDMRSHKIELVRPVARAETKEQLEAFLAAEKVERYSDSGERAILHTTDALAQMVGTVVQEPPTAHRWSKTFRKGGPLEWCNEPFSMTNSFVDVGTAEMWAERARQEFNRDVMVLPDVGSF